ncbi:MAG: hypothetical protein KJ077_07655 [Anaerolineae bacterium]|nr:hypothetical protein [Anaerolineae bacterium]
MKQLNDLARTFRYADEAARRRRITTALVIAAVACALTFLTAYLGFIALSFVLSLVFSISATVAVAQTKPFWWVVDLYTPKDDASRKAQSRAAMVILVIAALFLLYYLISS